MVNCFLTVKKIFINNRQAWKKVFAIFYVLIISFTLMKVSLANNLSTDLVKKWGGLWVNVNNLGQIMPEEELSKTVNIYDFLRITKVNKNGFNYRNAGNDVGYGPNEVTYFQGEAVYTDNGHAIDKKNKVRLLFTQGNKQWDRGITLVSVDKKEKFFKQKRTVFEAGFNCDKAVTHIEKAICAQPVLARADREMGKLYRQLRKTLSKIERVTLQKDQRLWIKKRNRKCQNKVQADKHCLSANYSLRLLQLRKQSDSEFAGNDQLLDAAYMNSIYGRNTKLWEDTVFRLYMTGIKKEDVLLEWRTYKPEIDVSYTAKEAVFTGKYQYQTIIWPNDVIVSKSFQVVVNNKSEFWVSINTDTGSGPEINTYGPQQRPLSVMQWFDAQRQNKN